MLALVGGGGLETKADKVGENGVSSMKDQQVPSKDDGAGGKDAEKENAEGGGPKTQKNHCSDCNKTFERLSNLKAHQRMHTGETPYKCKYPSCAKMFKWKSSLSSHMKSHDKTATAAPPDGGAKPSNGGRSDMATTTPKPAAGVGAGGTNLASDGQSPGLKVMPWKTPDGKRSIQELASSNEVNGVNTLPGGPHGPNGSKQPLSSFPAQHADYAFPTMQPVTGLRPPFPGGHFQTPVLSATGKAPGDDGSGKHGNGPQAVGTPGPMENPQMLPMGGQPIMHYTGMQWIGTPWMQNMQPAGGPGVTNFIYAAKTQPVRLLNADHKDAPQSMDGGDRTGAKGSSQRLGSRPQPILQKADPMVHKPESMMQKAGLPAGMPAGMPSAVDSGNLTGGVAMLSPPIPNGVQPAAAKGNAKRKSGPRKTVAKKGKASKAT